MKLHFPKKHEQPRKNPPAKRIDPLKRACVDLGRPELYTPLSRVLIANPRLAEKYFHDVLKRHRYRTAAGVMLYRSNLKEARRYFGMALKEARNDAVKQRLTITIRNFSTVAKIARRFWELTGKAKPKKKVQLKHIRRRKP